MNQIPRFSMRHLNYFTSMSVSGRCTCEAFCWQGCIVLISVAMFHWPLERCPHDDAHRDRTPCIVVITKLGGKLLSLLEHLHVHLVSGSSRWFPGPSNCSRWINEFRHRRPLDIAVERRGLNMCLSAHVPEWGSKIENGIVGRVEIYEVETVPWQDVVGPVRAQERKSTNSKLWIKIEMTSQFREVSISDRLFDEVHDQIELVTILNHVSTGNLWHSETFCWILEMWTFACSDSNQINYSVELSESAIDCREFSKPTRILSWQMSWA
jgi:hypothetical protein